MGRAERITPIALLGSVLALLGSAPADAQTDLFSRETLSGVADVRLQAADGEPSWTRAGFGKTTASGGGDSFAIRPSLDLAAVAWRPDLGHDFGAYILAQTQPGQDHAVDLAEAYLTWKPVPTSSALRLSARAGLMWPPASLEHDGPGWTTTRTLTPSAANTWISEEVKVAGIEGTASTEIAGHRLSATLAAFGNNDTSGTLLAFRGWALDDLRTTAFGTLPLPRFAPGARHHGQADEADPSLGLDGRIGGYAKLEWRPPAPVALEIFHYDNAGDPIVIKNGQWSWRTSFTDVGLTWRPMEGVEVLAQGLSGRTSFGRYTAAGRLVDLDFDTVYVLASRVEGRQRFTVRADGFRTQDLTFKTTENNDENGWSLTGDYAYAVNPHLTLWLEVLHVWSDRPSRADIGFASSQAQTVLQAAARTRF